MPAGRPRLELLEGGNRLGELQDAELGSLLLKEFLTLGQLGHDPPTKNCVPKTPGRGDYSTMVIPMLRAVPQMIR